jgi:hypothetical protein
VRRHRASKGSRPRITGQMLYSEGVNLKRLSLLKWRKPVAEVDYGCHRSATASRSRKRQSARHLTAPSPITPPKSAACQEMLRDQPNRPRFGISKHLLPAAGLVLFLLACAAPAVAQEVPFAAPKQPVMVVPAVGITKGCTLASCRPTIWHHCWHSDLGRTTSPIRPDMICGKDRVKLGAA